MPDNPSTQTAAHEPVPDLPSTHTAAHVPAVDAETSSVLQPPRRTGSLGRIAHYEVLEVLGRGGFGVVLKAFDDRLHRTVAVKVLAAQWAAQPTARARFVREARAAAAVRHDNVTVVHAVSGDDEPVPYLVMEYVAGPTLQGKLDAAGRLPVADVVRVGREVALGLAAAHATGLVHRDVKPANVLLEGTGERVKLTDFGLARATDDSTLSQSGTVAGTPTYMAPEQARGDPVDHRADLFSLGTVLYALLTGGSPFKAETTHAVLRKVTDFHPPPVGEVNADVPAWLGGLIAELHAKEPGGRPQSAREVAERLANNAPRSRDPESAEGSARATRGAAGTPALPSADSGSRLRGRSWGTRRLAVAALAVSAVGLAAVALIRPASGPPLAPPIAPFADPPPVAGPTDLLPLARPELSQFRWVVADGRLVHPPRLTVSPPPAVPLLVAAPDEFDLDAEVERTAGNDFVGFGLTAYGRRFLVEFDGWREWAGVSDVRGLLLDQNVTRRRGPWLVNGRRHAVHCEVRAAGVTATLDGRPAVDYRDGFDWLSANPPGLSGAVRFYVQANDDVGAVVHKLVLTPRPAADPPAVVASPADPAKPPPPTGVTDFREAHGVDVAGLTAWVNGLPAGFRPATITADADADPPRFNAVAVRDGATFELSVAVPAGRMQADFDAHAKAGWRPAWVCIYEDGGRETRHHLWVRADGQRWTGQSVTKGDRAVFDGLRTQSGRPVNPHVGRGASRNPNSFGATFVPAAGLDWEVRCDLSPGQFAAAVADARRRGWRPTDFDAATVNGTVQYTAVFVSNAERVPWEFRRDLSATAFEAAVAELKATRLRPHVVSSHGPLYTAVWVGYEPAAGGPNK